MKIFKILLVAVLMVTTPTMSAQYWLGETLTGTTQGVMENGQRVVDRTHHIGADGIPYLGLCLGASHLCGEFARLKACLGGISGFEVYGGVGKEKIFNGDYKDDLNWHAGIGYYFSDGVISGYGGHTSNVLSLSLIVAKTAYYSDPTIGAQFEWDHFFGESKRVGVIGSVGFALGDLDADEPDILWDVTIGFAVKIFK